MKKYSRIVLYLTLGVMSMLLAGCGDSLPHEDTVTETLQEAYSEYYGTLIQLKDFSVEYDNIEKVRKGVYIASASVTFTKDLTKLRQALDSKSENVLDEVAATMLAVKMQEQLRGEKSLKETHLLHISLEYVGQGVTVRYNTNEFE